MHFLLSVIDSSTNSATTDEMTTIDAFNEMLRANGHWFYANGISSPHEAIVVDNRDGTGVETTGPLHSDIEFIAGFWIVSAPDLATARALTFQASRACHRKIELRQLHGD